MNFLFLYRFPDPEDGGNGNRPDSNNGQTTNSSGNGDTSSDDSTDNQQASNGGPTAEHPELFFVDLYSLDLNGTPAWDVLAATPGFYGAILKATQGTKGWSNDGGWFKKNWQLLKDSGGDRYGRSWFRGAYAFLNYWQDGAAQADNYLEVIDDAGGWENGDIIPIIDVELGNDGSDGRHARNRNNDASKQQIIDCATSCANRLRSVTGRNVMLYGRGAMWDKSIDDKMGCDIVWNPAWTEKIDMRGLGAWTVDDVVLWQYCGDGKAKLDPQKFPHSVDNFGKCDISVYVEGSNKPSLETMMERLGIGP